MLGDKHRMSLHWGLFSVIRDNCRSFSLCNKILCVLPDHVKSLFINVINIFLFQMKTAPELRCLKMLEELFIPFFFCHQIHFPVNNDPALLLYLFLVLKPSICGDGVYGFFTVPHLRLWPTYTQEVPAITAPAHLLSILPSPVDSILYFYLYICDFHLSGPQCLSVLSLHWS